MARQAQKRAVKQRLNLKNNQGGKQSGHTIFKRSAQEEPDRIEFYDCDLRPSKLRELKSDETSDEKYVNFWFKIKSFALNASSTKGYAFRSEYLWK